MSSLQTGHLPVGEWDEQQLRHTSWSGSVTIPGTALLAGTS